MNKKLLLILFHILFIHRIGSSQPYFFNEKGKLRADSSFALPPGYVIPKFKCERCLMDSILKSLKYTPAARENEIQGKIIIALTFNCDSPSIINYSVLKNLKGALEKGILRNLNLIRPNQYFVIKKRKKYYLPLTFYFHLTKESVKTSEYKNGAFYRTEQIPIEPEEVQIKN